MDEYALFAQIKSTWSIAERLAFQHAFEQVVFDRHAVLPFRIGNKYRWPRAMLLYQKGDYRRAALKVAETQATERVRSVVALP